ncbi:MAG TPA: hypothetical protein VEU50_06575, partial [Archangium sp.]|nr:hypothetical protein [Archangium sp.]
LPGSVQAAAQAQTQVHIRLAAVGAVEMVSVSAETLTLSLAPGALAMTSRGPGEGNGSTSNNPGTANGTNSTTTRQQDGTTYRFNTGHAFNRAHKTGSDLRQTSLSSDEVETAIMSHLRTYRASGGRLPVAQNGAVPTPHIGRVTVGPYTLEFSAVQASNNTVFVGTYYLLP